MRDVVGVELLSGAPVGNARAAAGLRGLMPGILPVVFAGGDTGEWRVQRIDAVVGAALPAVPRLAVHEGARDAPGSATWVLRGLTGHERYVERRERDALVASESPLGRPEATCAALIPIQKSPAWWELTQDEWRGVFEERSAHIGIGLKYLPAVARRLHHSRELGEPFDFLTWFEFAPAHTAAFDDLVAMLRATEEWRYVAREVEVRLER